MECEKLAQEKTEMQRHYVMVSIIYVQGGWFFFFAISRMAKNTECGFLFLIFTKMFFFLSFFQFSVL